MEYKIEYLKTGLGSFVNKETRSEGGIFSNKIEGMMILEDMMSSAHINPEHCLELFYEIINLDMEIYPYNKKKHGDILMFNMSINGALMIFRDIIEDKVKDNKVIREGNGSPYLYICPVYGGHGKIYHQKGKTESFFSIKEGLSFLDDIYQKGYTNIIEKEELEKEIKESGLPPNDPEVLKRFN